jgi:hypothetical protein
MFELFHEITVIVYRLNKRRKGTIYNGKSTILQVKNTFFTLKKFKSNHLQENKKEEI